MTSLITKIARERSMTAREAAKKFGVSTRTIQRLVALDRDDYISRAADRRKQAYELRQSGLKWAEVGEKLGCSADAARALAKRYEPLPVNTQ